MKTVVQILSFLLFFFPLMAWSYDWEEEESGVEREIQLTRNRNYPGGADEQDIKVQKYLNQPSRSPEAAAEVVKRVDAEVDDHAND